MRQPPSRPPEHRGPQLDAVRIAGPDAEGALQDFTYSVIEATDDGNKRALPRRRTRLRSGKVLNLANRFLVECQIYDRSLRGARLRLLTDLAVPDRLRLYEDETDTLVDADVVWCNEREVGLRFTRDKTGSDMTKAQRAALRGKYYAVGR